MRFYFHGVFVKQRVGIYHTLRSKYWSSAQLQIFSFRLLWRWLFIVFTFHTLRHDEAAFWRTGATGKQEEWEPGGASEEWLPAAVLRDESQAGYFILSIRVCKWKCQSVWKTNGSDRRDATSLENAWSIAIVFFGRWCFQLFFLIVFPGRPGCLQLGVWFWTLSRGNKEDRSMAGINVFICYLQGLAVKKWFLD